MGLTPLPRDELPVSSRRRSTALQQHSRRVLPSGLGAPSHDPCAPDSADPAVAWLQPIPDMKIIPDVDRCQGTAGYYGVGLST
jgi:hypothetical protein